MDELSRIAKFYYEASPQHVKKSARDFFDAMDGNGDDKIDLVEFMEFMKEQGGGPDWTRPSFFEQLDRDGNGTLDFSEVTTIYYIIKSRRPFCYGCEKFIPGTYFQCIGCVEVERSYHLCLDCIQSEHHHTHGFVSKFVDNYSLLAMPTSNKKEKIVSSVVTVNNYTLNQNPPPPPPVQTTNIVNNYTLIQNPPPQPVQPPNGAMNIGKRRQALELTYGVLDTAITAAAIMGVCTIL